MPQDVHHGGTVTTPPPARDTPALTTEYKNVKTIETRGGSNATANIHRQHERARIQHHPHPHRQHNGNQSTVADYGVYIDTPTVTAITAKDATDTEKLRIIDVLTVQP